MFPSASACPARDRVALPSRNLVSLVGTYSRLYVYCQPQPNNVVRIRHLVVSVVVVGFADWQREIQSVCRRRREQVERSVHDPPIRRSVLASSPMSFSSGPIALALVRPNQTNPRP